MSWCRIIHGDVLAGLASLADESVHCVVTSPPYWNLRDYGRILGMKYSTLVRACNDQATT